MMVVLDMRFNKTFTIDEARAMLPKLRKILKEADQQLESFVDKLEAANIEHQRIEINLSNLRLSSEETGDLRACRAEFEESIRLLSELQGEYVRCMTMWVDEITDMGIVLRDIHTGLLDFPAEKGTFSYLLCWRLADDDIEYWHLLNDGFRGRRPLSVLEEYF